MERNQFKENVILVDVAFVDDFATVTRQHFSEILGQEIPMGQFHQLLICAAVEAKLPQCDDKDAKQEIQVVLVSGKDNGTLKNYLPNKLEELDGRAFMSPRHGEFQMSVVRDERLYDEAEPLMTESAKVLMDDKHIKRLVVINHPDHYEAIAKLSEQVEGKEVNILVVPPAFAKDETDAWRVMHMVQYSLTLRTDEMDAKYSKAINN